jgi:hypothetical protein
MKYEENSGIVRQKVKVSGWIRGQIGCCQDMPPDSTTRPNFFCREMHVWALHLFSFFVDAALRSRTSRHPQPSDFIYPLRLPYSSFHYPEPVVRQRQNEAPKMATTVDKVCPTPHSALSWRPYES